MVSFVPLSWSFRNFPLPKRLPSKYHWWPHFPCLLSPAAPPTLTTDHTLPYINFALGILDLFLDSWTLKMGPIGCPETSVRNYHNSLRNNPEERSFYLLRGGSPTSLTEECVDVRGKLCACAVLYCHLWIARLCNILSHYVTMGTIFEKQKLLNIKCVFDCVYNFVWKMSHSKKNWARQHQTRVRVCM